VLRIWKSWRGNANVENMLRASMPRPDEAFPAALRERVQRPARPRLRVAAALAIAAVSVAAFAGFGGLGYAASAADDAVTSVVDTITPGPSHHGLTNASPSGDQYGACSIGDYVWIDKNGNGIQDDGAGNGVDGVLVELLFNGNVVATDTTASLAGAPGFYLFEQVACGMDFRVRVAASNFAPGGPLEGKIPTTLGAGGNPALDSNGDASSTSGIVNVPSGSNLTIDFGYLCPLQICPDGEGFGGNFFLSFDTNGNLHVKFSQFTNFNDNSYGTNAVGWGTKGHKFQDLTNSDNAQFAITNGAGQVVLQFKLDYVTCNTAYTTASKCKTLGPDGGDGGMVKGQRAWVLDFDTSLDQNLNDLGFCTNGSCLVSGVDLKVNSPPTTGPNSYTLADPAFTGWNFNNVYEATIDKAAWGAAGFGGVSLAAIHNSPSKPGATCPPGEGGGALCSGDTKLGSLTMRYTGEACQTPLPNPQSGKATCTGTLNANQPVRIVATSKDGKKTYFDSVTANVDIAEEFVISAAMAGQTKLDADTLVKFYNASGTLIQTVQFHTSCSQLIAVGDRFGAMQIVSGVNVPK
jgi:hypothetical protein